MKIGNISMLCFQRSCRVTTAHHRERWRTIRIQQVHIYIIIIGEDSKIGEGHIISGINTAVSSSGCFSGQARHARNDDDGNDDGRCRRATTTATTTTTRAATTTTVVVARRHPPPHPPPPGGGGGGGGCQRRRRRGFRRLRRFPIAATAAASGR